MKPAVFLALVLGLSASGCATVRLVEVNTNRIEAEQPGGNGTGEAVAVAVLREVAGDLGFSVEGPIQDPRVPDEREYSAHEVGRTPANRTWLILGVDKRHIRFISRIYGTAADFQRAQRAAVLIEQALARRNIPYKVSTRKRLNPLND